MEEKNQIKKLDADIDKIIKTHDEHVKIICNRIVKNEKTIEQLKEDIKDKNIPKKKHILTYDQSRILEYHLDGIKGKDIAWKMSCCEAKVSVHLKKMKKWGLCN